LATGLIGGRLAAKTYIVRFKYPSHLSADNENMIGQDVAQYRITGQLGQGGMGVVYLADDTTLERKVALKFLPEWANSDSDAQGRFIHEAKSASALDHPSIATIHDVRRTDDGRLYIVMGYYEGVEIADLLADDGPMPIEDAIDYASQVADGLSCAHEKGIIHRDIKPGNVIVTPKGRAVILDFGLAKVQDVTMTQDGTSLGTLAYMSPEQAKNEGVDARTDLWALGVVLYEMLAGRRPFDAGYDAAILYAAAHEPHTSVQAWRSEVPDWLSAVVDRLLAKQPDDRFQSAADVVQALKDGPNAGATTTTAATPTEVAAPVSATDLHPAPYLVDPRTGAFVTPDGKPLTQYSQGPFAQTGAFQQAPPTRSKAALWGGGTALAVLVIAVVGWFIGQSSGTPDASEITPADHEQARTLHTSALKLRSERKFTLARGELERAVALDSTYSEAWTTLTAIDVNMQDFQAAIEHGDKAVHLDQNNAAAWYNLAYALEELGRYDDSMATYSGAIKADSTFVPAYSALGNRLIELGRAEEAIPVLQRGFTKAPSDPLRYLLFKNIGKANLALDKPADAIGPLEASVGLKGDLPESLSLLADAYERSGQGDLAGDYWDRYLQAETDPEKKRVVLARLGR
jgi:serine/threonine protein kinase/Tfp pilus assembly protein PilF